MSTFSTNDSTVNSFYLAFYGRPADPAGLKFWSAQLAANNGDMGAIVDFFAASEEAQVRFGTDTVADRITEIYSHLFNRSPDAEGMAFWTNAIEQGHASLADIAMSIQGGAQGSDATLSQLRKQAADAFTAKVEADGSEYSGYASIEAARILVRAVTADATQADLDTLVNAAVSFADTATKTPQVVDAIAVNTTLLALFDTARGVKEPVALAKALADTAKAAAGDPVTLESLLRGGGMDKVLKVMPAKATLEDVVKALADGGLPAAVEVVYPTAPTTPSTPTPAGMKLSFVSVDQSEQDHVLDDTTNLSVANVKFKYTGPDLVKGQHFEYSIDGGASWIDHGLLEDTVANTVTIQELYLGGMKHSARTGDMSTQDFIPPANVTTKVQLRAVEGKREIADVTKEIVYDRAAPSATLTFFGIDGKEGDSVTTKNVVDVDFKLTDELGAGDFVEYRMKGSDAWIKLDSKYVKDGSVTIPGIDLSKADQTVQVRVTDNAGNANEFVATPIDGPVGVVLQPSVLVMPTSAGLLVGATAEGTFKLVDSNKSTSLEAVKGADEGAYQTYTIGEQEHGVKGIIEFTPTGGTPMIPPQIANQVIHLGSKAGETISGSFVWGFGGDDVITGTGSETSLFGGDGNDTITGVIGRDMIVGGKGGDLIDLGHDEFADVVQYELDDDAELPFVDNTSTAAIDKISNFGVGDELRIGVMFGQSVVLSTDYLSAGGNPDQYAIVRGSDAGGVFIKGSSVSDDDYMVQWSNGGKVVSTILHNFGTAMPKLLAYSNGFLKLDPDTTPTIPPVPTLPTATVDGVTVYLGAGISMADIGVTNGSILSLANPATFELSDFGTGAAKALPDYDALAGAESINVNGNLQFKSAQSEGLTAGLYQMTWGNNTFMTTNGLLSAGKVYFAGGEDGTYLHRGFVLDAAPAIIHGNVDRAGQHANEGFITDGLAPVRIVTGEGNDVIVDQGSDVTVVYDRIDDAAQDLVFGFGKYDTVLLDGDIAAAVRKDNDDDIAWADPGDDIFASTEGASVVLDGFMTIGTSYGQWGEFTGDLFTQLNLKLTVSEIAQDDYLLILANGNLGDSNVLFLYQNMDNNGKIDAAELTTIAMFAEGAISTANIELVGTQIEGEIIG